MSYLLIFIGGGLGCMARYGMASLTSKWYAGPFPLATFLSNTISTSILLLAVGYISAQHPDAKWVRPLVIIGFCGGFSTFSTFSFETVQLMKNGNPWVAVANVVVSVAGCLYILHRWGR